MGENLGFDDAYFMLSAKAGNINRIGALSSSLINQNPLNVDCLHTKEHAK